MSAPDYLARLREKNEKKHACTELHKLKKGFLQFMQFPDGVQKIDFSEAHDAANDPPRLPDGLARAALAVCRFYGDGEDQQQAMFDDLAVSPPEHWPALEGYFRRKLDPVTCASCRHARPYPRPAIVACAAGVNARNPTGGRWATDSHVCPWFVAS